MERQLIFISNSELLRVMPSSVVFITADGNYSVITTVIGSEHTLTLQLGQIEQKIALMSDPDDCRFIRIGKSLIVNRDYITFINVPRQRLILSDSRTFKHELSASKEALKLLKTVLEEEYHEQ